MRRRLPCLAAIVIAAAGCHHPPPRATSGDEVPYPAIDEASLDRNASPCTDFYQFACGGWISVVRVPPDRTRWTHGEGEVEERDARLLRRILEDAGAGKVSAQERFGRKAGDFYAACMADADVEARGLAELQAEWARLDAVSNRADLADELSRLSAMGVRAPLGVRAGPDPASAARSLLVLGPSGAGPAAREDGAAPLEAATGRAARERYPEHVERMLSLGGLPPARAAEEAAAAVALERSFSPPAQADAEGAAHASGRLDRGALQRLAPGFPWSRFLRALGAERLDAFAVTDPGLLARVGEAFQAAPLPAWRAYLRLQLAEELAAERALPASMVQEWFRFQGTLAPAPAELRPRWKHCVDATARALELAVGGAFGRRNLRPAGRNRGGWLVTHLHRGLQVTIESAPWIDAATQTRAAEKLDRLAVQVGYPDAVPDYGALRVGRDSYFRNVLSAGRFAVAQEVARASRPVDRGEWLLGPHAAHPQYSAARNALCVPAGALQPPVYNTAAPDAVVFGAMGAEVGRALSGAVQGAGRLRGPDGSAADWWTGAAARGFEERAACLVQQYDAYVAGGVRLDGRRTLDANLADLAGLRAAYEALRAARNVQPGVERRVLGFTSDQQFFLAYAQSLCTVATDADAAEEAAHGARAPARFRVNGPLSNLPEFARAFSCAAGAPMVRAPPVRCDVW